MLCVASAVLLEAMGPLERLSGLPVVGFLFSGPAWLVGAKLAAVLLCLWLLVAVLRQAFGGKERRIARRARQLADQGRYEDAGDLHVQQGNLQAAVHLFEQARAWEKAARAARKLGQDARAARFAERAARSPDEPPSAQRRLPAPIPVEPPPPPRYEPVGGPSRAVAEPPAPVALAAAPPAAVPAPAPAPPAAEGRALPDVGRRYVIEKEIGRGGMAVVYRARDTVLGRTVALKFLPYGLSQHPTLTDLFYREARAAATLNHPAIVTIYDLGIAEGRPFISMEFVQGVDVLRLLQKRGPLPVGEAVWIALEAAAALEHAHRHGLVHRDVKPSNLMITVERTLKVMDFGLAALMASQRKETVVSGTPGYMAPEQFTGQPVDPRADVFGLAVTLYEMLVGELPFQGFTRNVKPQPPSATRVDVPVELDEVILQALEADPAKRPPSAASLASAIRNACHLPPPPEETA